MSSTLTGDIKIMRSPLQALLIAPVGQSKVQEGQKLISIRDGHRDYRIGQLMLCCPITSWCVGAVVTEVRHTTLDEVTLDECLDDGVPDQLTLLQDLCAYYPDVGPNTQVTVIRWRLK